MILFVKYIRVSGRGDEPMLRDFLYSSAHLLKFMEIPNSVLPEGYPKNQFVGIVRVESAVHDYESMRVAEYQARRFRSNLWQAHIFDSPDDLNDWENEHQLEQV